MKTLLRFAAVFILTLAAFSAWGGQVAAQNVSENEAYANVVPCMDVTCDTVDPAGMEGVVITSYDAAGVEIDSCAVEVFPASGMHGCVVTTHDGSGSYEVSNLTAGFTLIDDAPEVLESQSHGTQLVWYAVAAADPVPPVETPVERLPEVGVGIGHGASAVLLAVGAIGLVLMGIGAGGMRWIQHR